MVIALMVLFLPSLVLQFCPLEYQLVPVADIQVIGDLKGSVVRVVVVVEEADHWGSKS